MGSSHPGLNNLCDSHDDVCLRLELVDLSCVAAVVLLCIACDMDVSFLRAPGEAKWNWELPNLETTPYNQQSLSRTTSDTLQLRRIASQSCGPLILKRWPLTVHMYTHTLTHAKEESTRKKEERNKREEGRMQERVKNRNNTRNKLHQTTKQPSKQTTTSN